MYHFFPGRQWENAPQWLVSVCIRSIPLIRAEQAKYDALATRVAFSDKKGWKDGLKSLERMAQPERLKKPLELPTPANDAAADWFTANGIPYKPANGPH